ncbi:hypothetical protein ACRYCC_19910 [Actinomadura scrupuli]|uniref:hypothetical protein n=1 Tax=Actinomadura scrupuli TaxID=559629 RepID=UPI003D99DFCC
MRVRRFLTALACVVTGTALVMSTAGPANAGPARPAAAGVQRLAPAAVSVPVVGTFTDNAGGTGRFVGKFIIDRFVNQNGAPAASGTFTGTLTDSAGTSLGTASQQAVVPLAVAQATCAILHLTLGPLDLDLLGLKVHLDRVVLNIDASQAPGNLLGNLLCAIAGLLDPLQLNTLLGLLNQILALLRG